MSLFAFMLAAVAPPQPPPIELQPSGKWQVEYAKSSCIVSRQFGEGQHKTLFGLKPSPYSESVTMLIARQAPKQRGVGGKAEVMLSGGLVPEYARYTSVSSNEMRVTTIEVPRSTLDPLAKGESIAIQAGNGVNVVLKPTAFDKAKKAMDD